MKHIYFFFIAVVLISGCSSDDSTDQELAINITQFQTSYHQVLLQWEISQPENSIVESFTVERLVQNGEDPTAQFISIAELDETQTSFIDTDVPYYSDLIYKVKVFYHLKNSNLSQTLLLESLPQHFTRNLVLLEIPPFQVQKDAVNPAIFHMLDKSGAGAMKRYDTNQKQVTATVGFLSGWDINNRFQIINGTDIYVGDYYGKITKINASTYQKINTFNTAITDRLTTFTVDGDRIFYEDGEVMGYHNMTDNISTSMNNGINVQYMESLSPGKFLLLYNSSGIGSGAAISQLQGDCPNGSGCYFLNLATMFDYQGGINKIDPNVFSWNDQKTKYISGIEGRVYNGTTLQQEKRLSEITGEWYINFAFDNAGNIYGSVQGKKLVHKFNANYELVASIPTKLYPLFPLPTASGLQVIGSYEPVSYSVYDYGYAFNFNVKCAIETF